MTLTNAEEEKFLLPSRPAGVSDADWREMTANAHSAMHTEISKHAPITGVSGNTQDVRFYTIHFEDSATNTQRGQARQVMLDWPEKYKKEQHDLAAVRPVDAWFNAQIAAGFKAPNSNITLGLKTEDIALLTGNFVMAQQAVALGQPVPPIVDMHGLVHFFANIEELVMLMLAYGQYRANLALEYVAKKAEALEPPLATPPPAEPEQPADSV